MMNVSIPWNFLSWYHKGSFTLLAVFWRYFFRRFFQHAKVFRVPSFFIQRQPQSPTRSSNPLAVLDIDPSFVTWFTILTKMITEVWIQTDSMIMMIVKHFWCIAIAGLNCLRSEGRNYFRFGHQMLLDNFGIISNSI